MRRSSLYGIVTFVALTVALTICVVGLVEFKAAAVQVELAVEGLALAAAITGVFAERYASASERRQQVIEAVRQEVVLDAKILDSDFLPMTLASARQKVYRRMPLSAADAAVNSGALGTSGDRVLVDALHQWRDVAQDFNHRLDLTELRMFLLRSEAPEGMEEQLLEVDRGLHGFLEYVRVRLAAVCTEIERLDSKESKVARSFRRFRNLRAKR